MPVAQGNQRVTARVPAKIYETLAQAAELTGATLNQFIVQSAYNKAQEVLDHERLIRMTTRSATTFFKALDHPPNPNEKLKKAAKAYRG